MGFHLFNFSSTVSLNLRPKAGFLKHCDFLFVFQVITHPLYNPQALINDIALLILDTPFKLAENVGIVCLPPPGLRHDNTKCTTSGWGKSSRKKGTYQSILKKIDVPLVPRSKCLKSLRNARLGPQFHLHRSFICAGGGSRDACKGDGGSPLFCEVEGERGRYEQVGIVSWGLTCGVFETPGVYVNVGLFSEWIDGEMGGHGFDTNIYRYWIFVNKVFVQMTFMPIIWLISLSLWRFQNVHAWINICMHMRVCLKRFVCACGLLGCRGLIILLCNHTQDNSCMLRIT